MYRPYTLSGTMWECLNTNTGDREDQIICSGIFHSWRDYSKSQSLVGQTTWGQRIVVVCTGIYYLLFLYPTVTQQKMLWCWFNVGPLSAMLAHHWTNFWVNVCWGWVNTDKLTSFSTPMINIHDLSVRVTPNMAIKHNVITMCVGKTTGTVYQNLLRRCETT